MADVTETKLAKITFVEPNPSLRHRKIFGLYSDFLKKNQWRIDRFQPRSPIIASIFRYLDKKGAATPGRVLSDLKRQPRGSFNHWVEHFTRMDELIAKEGFTDPQTLHVMRPNPDLTPRQEAERYFRSELAIAWGLVTEYMQTQPR